MLVEEIAEVLIRTPKEIGKMLLEQKVTSEEVENAIAIMHEGIEFAASAVKLHKGLKALQSYKAGTGSSLEEALDLIKDA